MIPHLAPNSHGIPTLYVHDRPFLILGGELHNSSCSSPSYMEEKVWPALRALPLNTVIAPVYWEALEPREGSFDYSLVDSLLLQARREGKKLILLWFGIWKNGETMYAPSWVKNDPDTYFRACYSPGNPSDTVSALCGAATDADARAFTRLMAHLKETDGEENTVIMVQVENEIGFLGAERDFSQAAQEAYHSPIPAAMQEYAGAQTEGSWHEVFGENAPELFMTYHYCLAIEQIAAAGKAEYPLPMNVNAWLEQFPEIPGSYPCGGPIAKYMGLWKKLVPSIDMLSPDIYLSDFKGVCDEYSALGNPLFIPEARRDPVTASNVFYAFGQYNALGFSPFGIEDMQSSPDAAGPAAPQMPDAAVMAALNIDLSAFSCTGTGPYLQRSYTVLSQMTGYLSQLRGSGQIHAFIRKNEHDKGCILSLPEADVKLTYTGLRPDQPGSAGFLIENGRHGFYAVGCNFKIELLAKKGSEKKVSLVRLEEGDFIDDAFCPGRILNGDERMRAGIGPMAGVLRFEFCLY